MEGRVEKVTKEWNRPIYSLEEYKQHLLCENHIHDIKSKSKHKDNVKSRLGIDE